MFNPFKSRIDDIIDQIDNVEFSPELDEILVFAKTELKYISEEIELLPNRVDRARFANWIDDQFQFILRKSKYVYQTVQ